MPEDQVATLPSSGPDPGRCTLRHVVRASRAVAAAFDRALEPSGLTGRQFNLLMTLERRGEHNVKGLAAELGMDATTVPRALGPLAARGLVETGPGATRRERAIAITADGRRALAAAYPRWRQLQEGILSTLGDEGWAETTRRLESLRLAATDAAGPVGG